MMFMMKSILVIIHLAMKIVLVFVQWDAQDLGEVGQHIIILLI